jgi:predicted  nucleic acid-binding Zn-ribbon protein
MNKAQRKTIEDIRGNLQNELERIESERDAEQEKFDNMPESLQNSDKGQAMEEGISTLDEAIEGVQSAIDALDNIGN